MPDAAFGLIAPDVMAEAWHCAKPRLIRLPLAARGLWLALADAMARGPFPGTLPFAGSDRLALLVSVSTEEVELHLPSLLAAGLVTRANGGGLACPLLLAAAMKQNARNGRHHA